MVLAHDERLPSLRDRLVARAIDDGLIVFVAGALLVPGLALEIYGMEIAGLVTLYTAWVVYDAIWVGATGRTLGKKIRGLRVARLADGGKPTVLQAIVRALVLPWVGWYSLIFTKTHRSWHDKAAGTIVVYDS
jgi:uncharacterized RDD family membrane protein YckC